MENTINSTTRPTHKQNSALASNKLAIYLAGSIKKGHEPLNELFWTDVEMDVLREALPEFEIGFLNPALRCDNLSSQKSVFGMDMLMVYSSDIVLVDARQRRGLGVGSEMMWAKVNRIPVVTFAPMDSHYRMSNASVLGCQVKDWVHPFVECLSDYIANSLEEAALWITRHLDGENDPIKDISSIHEAMAFYHETQYTIDLPMQELVENSERLKNRLIRATMQKPNQR
jgi:hypothetical protein